MAERTDLLTAIATTIQDYRAGELPQPTPDHVERWIRQFDSSVQLPMLRELDYVLARTYFTKASVSSFFSDLITHKQLAGEDPCAFWSVSDIFDIQQNGNSQSEIRGLFGDALNEKCGLQLDCCGGPDGAFIYLDDVLFSGGRIGDDLERWITVEAPEKAKVHVIVITAHRFGEWKCKNRLLAAAKNAGKVIDFLFWAALRIENRNSARDRSEVLWPALIPDDVMLKAYMSEETRFPFQPRNPGGQLQHPVFSSEQGRQLLERELLLAGLRIRSFSQNPSRILRPLGFSPFGLGFGSMIATYRNCPNNTPLALWWGDPSADPSHPFSKWYPLLQRKTYA
jgi:hypothetical protein